MSGRGHRADLAFLTLLVAGCGSPVPTDTPITGPPPLALTGAGPFLVSNPVSLGSGNLIQGSAPSGQVAFVSLPPGTLAGGATATLMQRFYERYEEGVDPARTLAEAQRTMLALPATAHPYYWAAFEVIGGQ